MSSVASWTRLTERVSIPRLRPRYQLLLAAAFYQAALQWAYVQEISPRWAYAGFTYARPPLALWILATVMALLPALWIPLNLSRPSTLLYLYLYLAAFSPAPFVLLARATSDGRPFHYMPFLVVLLACFALLAGVYRLPLLRVWRPAVPRRLFWAGVLAFLVIGNVVIVFAFGGSLRIAGSGEVLEQRLGAGEIFAVNRAAGYFFTLLAFAVNPLILAVGLWQRRWYVLAVGAVGQVLLYSVNAARGLIAAIALTLIIYGVIRWARRNAVILVVGIAAVGIAGCIGGANLVSGPRQQDFDWLVYRTFMIPASTSGDYYDFFKSNPRTDFTHIHGLGMLGENPYEGRPIGIVVGSSRGSPDHNENGNLWADGFASAGFAGVLIATFLASLVFLLLDSLASHVPTALATLAIVPHAANLADIPIFTAFLGSGLGLTILLLYLIPLPTAGGRQDPSRSGAVSR